MKQKRKPSIGYEQAPMRTLIQCGTEVAAAQTEIEETILDYSSVGLCHECHERRLWAACLMQSSGATPQLRTEGGQASESSHHLSKWSGKFWSTNSLDLCLI
jgi:hypothetical protein